VCEREKARQREREIERKTINVLVRWCVRWRGLKNSDIWRASSRALVRLCAHVRESELAGARALARTRLRTRARERDKSLIFGLSIIVSDVCV